MSFTTRVLVITAVLLFASRSASAQGLGYGIAGPGAVSGFFGGGLLYHVAGGGEFLLNSTTGIGGEVGALGNSSSVLFVTSVNGVVHLSNPTDRRSPFLTGGYSRFSSGDGTFNAFNIGVGADFWSSDHTAVRVEFRDNIRPDSRGAVHYVSVRAGISFKLESAATEEARSLAVHD